MTMRLNPLALEMNNHECTLLISMRAKCMPNPSASRPWKAAPEEPLICSCYPGHILCLFNELYVQSIVEIHNDTLSPF